MEFKHQTDALDLQDLEATWQVVQVATSNICQSLRTLYRSRTTPIFGCLQAVPQGALAYFNCGPESGASQPHKHIQVQQCFTCLFESKSGNSV